MSETYMIQRLNAQCRCFRDARRGWAGAVVTKREACHDNAKLERCRSPLRVSYLVFFFCSFCKRVYRNHQQRYIFSRNLQTTHTTPRRLDLHASSARHLLEVTAALCTAPARPRVQPALAYTARGLSPPPPRHRLPSCLL
jgi:hypothetical protein